MVGQHARLTWGIVLSLLVSTAEAQQATFHHLPAENGQKIWQHLTVFANTTTTYEQASQKIARQHRHVTREQVRRLTILDARPGPQNVVQVRYEKAQRTHSSAGRQAAIEPQPVAGKTYVVHRPAEELVVTGENGTEVTPEEIRIVRENMQSVGRANPLAKFLNGKTLQVGQRVQLPANVAEEMLGWQSDFGKPQEVTLTLNGLQTGTGQVIADFELQIEGESVEGMDDTTRINGALSVEVNTCRVVATNLKAVVAVRQQRGPTGNTFYVSHQGKANIHTQVRFLR